MRNRYYFYKPSYYIEEERDSTADIEEEISQVILCKMDTQYFWNKELTWNATKKLFMMFLI